MSRTIRRILQRPDKGQPPDVKRRPESAARRSFDHRLRRDSAATGLREHKQERARTRRKLKTEPEREDIRAGRTRKYQDRRGIYRL